MILCALRKMAARTNRNVFAMQREGLRRVFDVARGFAGEVGAVYLTLLKVMVPALVVVKALDLFGATAWVAAALSPVMGLVGLPAETAIVWAAAMLVIR